MVVVLERVFLMLLLIIVEGGGVGDAVVDAVDNCC